MDHSRLAAAPLFRGISEAEISSLLQCLRAVVRTYPKNTVIYPEGEPVQAAGLLLSGEVHIQQTDFWGGLNILAAITPGQLFSEAYACVPGTCAMAGAVAAKDCQVLFLDISRVLHTCPSACAFHTHLIQNLLADLARKNLRLTQKITHTAPKSIRGRVLSYLSLQAAEQGTNHLEISFDRQQLADYLCVERSALSNELSKMRRDGLIEYRKNHFTLKPDRE